MYICLCIHICSYHWILLVLNMETGNLVVFDSMRCPKEAIQRFLDHWTGKFNLHNQILFMFKIIIIQYQT